ncbi:MAG: HAMP domain-containing histidine kinase [Clostridia bacterium]|nr:HAMP domain-containing histidine kinase [Clostridia bacterium]
MGKNRKKKSRKIFNKYLIVITSIILLSVFILCSSYLFIATKNWNTEQKKTLQHNSDIIASNSEQLLQSFYEHYPTLDENDDTEFTPLMMICNNMSIMSEAIGADIFITNMNGDVIVCKEMNDGKFMINSHFSCFIHKNYHIDKSFIEEASDGEFSEVSTLGGIFRTNQITTASPITVNGKTNAIVFATEPITQSWYEYARRILQIFLIAALLAMVVSFITVYFLSYRLTRPLRQMSEATKHYAQGDFSYKVTVRGHDEMAELAQAFNSMAMALSTLEVTRRSFVANVSHELKTPMTSIGGFIDGMLDGTIPQESYNHYLHIVSDEVKRLSRLVTGMLNMSKLEAGEMPMNVKEFDISKNIFKTLLSFEKKINDKSIEIIGLDSMESTMIRADEDMLMQVVYNLIDNAVKFTPEGGYIFIKDFRDSEKTFVSIRNSGEGIERDELSKVFERFYKIDKSRSYDVRGAGLGLYLCKSIVELHGGEIKVESKVGEYTEFAFWIPNNI